MRFDPLIPNAVVDRVSIKDQLVQNMVQAMRQNILAPGVYQANALTRPAAAPVLGEDGQEMTPERRRQLAEERNLKDLDWEKLNKGEVEGENPLHSAPIESEPMGASAQLQLPGMRVIRPQEAHPLTKEFVEDLYAGKIPLAPDVMNLPANKPKE